MKAKLTVTIAEELIPKAKSYARGKGLSLSELVETSLLTVTKETGDTTFSQRWRGKFKPANKSDARYQALAKRYL